MVADELPDDELPPLSDRLEAWFSSDRAKTVGDLIETFGSGSFAVLFVVLLALPAMPLPTGGVSHVLEVIAMLLALELIAGRREVWVPARWRDRAMPAVDNARFQAGLLRRIRWLERYARPRLSRLIEVQLVRRLYGLSVLLLSLTAFLAPPFSGLDTIPSIGVVVLSLGVLLHDFVVATIGAAIGAAGVLVVITLGRAIAGLF